MPRAQGTRIKRVSGTYRGHSYTFTTHYATLDNVIVGMTRVDKVVDGILLTLLTPDYVADESNHLGAVQNYIDHLVDKRSLQRESKKSEQK